MESPPATLPPLSESQAIEELALAVTNLTDYVHIFREALDDLREDIEWLIENGLPLQADGTPLQHVHVKSFAADPCDPNWAERVQLSVGTPPDGEKGRRSPLAAIEAIVSRTATEQLEVLDGLLDRIRRDVQKLAEQRRDAAQQEVPSKEKEAERGAAGEDAGREPSTKRAGSNNAAEAARDDSTAATDQSDAPDDGNERAVELEPVAVGDASAQSERGKDSQTQDDGEAATDDTDEAIELLPAPTGLQRLSTRKPPSQPLYIRMYNDKAMVDLVRAFGHDAYAVGDARAMLQELSKKHGQESIYDAQSELLQITPGDTAAVQLTNEARRLGVQVIGRG